MSARESTAFQPLSDASTLQRHLSTLERTQAEGKRYFSLLPNMSIKMKITANLLTAFSLGNKLTPFTKKYHYEAEIFSLALSTEGHAIYNTLLGEVNDEVRMRYLMHMATKATNVVPELADYAEPCTFTSGAPIAADKNSLKREAILRFSEHKMRMPLKLMTSQISRLTLEKMFLRIHIVRERDFLNLDPRDKIKGTYVFSILHLIEELLRLDDGVAYKQAKLPNGQKEQRVTILGSFKLIRDDPRENRVNPFSKRDFVGDQGNSFMPSIYVYRILGADVYLSDIQMKKINVDFGAVVKRRPSIKRSMGTDTAQLCMSMKNVYLKAEARVHVSLKPEQVKVVGITTLHDDVAVAAKLASSEVCVEPDRNEGGDFIIHSEITKSSLAVQIIDPFDIRLSSTISAINPQINTMAKDLITWILEQYVFSDYSVRKMYTDDGMERDAPVTDAMVTVCDLLEQLDSNRDVQLPQIELFVSIRELILNKEFATLTPAFSSWLALYLFQAGFKVSNGDSQTDRLLFNAPSDVNRLSYGIFSS